MNLIKMPLTTHLRWAVPDKEVYDPLSTEKKSSEMIVEPPDRRREKDWDDTYYVVRMHFSETRKVQRQIFPDNFPA